MGKIIEFVFRLIIFGLFFIIIPGLFCFLLIAPAATNLDAMFFWKSANCTISANEIRAVDCGYRLELQYNYTVGASLYTASSILPRSMLDSKNSSVCDDNYGYFVSEAAKYPIGKTLDCLYNHKAPAEAALETRLRWDLLLLPFPLIFLLIGLAIVFSALFPNFRWASSSEVRKPLSLSSATKTVSPRVRRFGWFLAFLISSLISLAGGGILYNKCYKPLRLESQNWQETKCLVINSRVHTIRGDDTNSYRPDILYQYEVNGTAYRSNRYNFYNNSVGGSYSGAQQVSQSYPVNSVVRCFYNADEPQEAVLQNYISSENVFWVLGFLFLLAGLFMGLRFLRNVFFLPATKAETQTIFPAQSKSREARPRGTFVSRSTLTFGSSRDMRIGKFLGSLLAASIVNGFIAFALYDNLSGSFNLFSIFLIPFVLAGLGLIKSAFLSFLAFFSPLIRLSASTNIRPADTLEISWSLSGRTSAAEALSIYLEGEEVATYRQGTDTLSDKRRFFKAAIVEIPAGSGIQKTGSATYTLPKDLIPSFATANNKICWSVRVVLGVKSLPDVIEEQEISIIPGQAK